MTPRPHLPQEILTVIGVATCIKMPKSLRSWCHVILSHDFLVVSQRVCPGHDEIVWDSNSPQLGCRGANTWRICRSRVQAPARPAAPPQKCKTPPGCPLTAMTTLYRVSPTIYIQYCYAYISMNFSPCIHHILPLVPHKEVAEVSRIGHYRIGELL